MGFDAKKRHFIPYFGLGYLGFVAFQVLLGYICLQLQGFEHYGELVGSFSFNGIGLVSQGIAQKNGRRAKMTSLSRDIDRLINEIGALTIMGSVLGAMYSGLGGAIAGAVVGFILDKLFRDR